jgi:hypothetical protein
MGKYGIGEKMILTRYGILLSKFIEIPIQRVGKNLLQIYQKD